MSVSHPLLKELKGYIIQLRSYELTAVNDDNPLLLPLCLNLESIFGLGLRSVPTIVGLVKQEYWNWVELLGKSQLVQLSFKCSQLINSVQQNPKVSSTLGKGRLFIRSCLVHGVLAEIVEVFLRQCLEGLKLFYTDSSCFGDEILCEIMLSLMHPLKDVKFNLQLDNCSFLDESWLLPVYKEYEFVPCMSLGISIGYSSKNRAVVVEVEEGSVAAEDNKIEVGDIVDDVDGFYTSACSKSKAMALFRRCREKPLQISVVKCIASNGTVFLPLYPALRELNLETTVHSRKKQSLDVPCKNGSSPVEKLSSNSVQTVICSSKMKLKYLGSSNVGSVGTMSVIEGGIMRVLERRKRKEDVWLDAKEMFVTVTSCEDEKVLFNHNYTQVGSCGRRVDFPLLFCYVAGESGCNIAKNFTCYVFEGSNEDEVKGMLKLIALGFQRTHWAV